MTEGSLLRLNANELLQVLAEQQLQDQQEWGLTVTDISHPARLFSWFTDTPDFGKICEEAIYGRKDIPENSGPVPRLADLRGALFQQILDYAYPIWTTKNIPGRRVVINHDKTTTFCQKLATEEAQGFVNAFQVLDSLRNTSLNFDALRLRIAKSGAVFPEATCEYTRFGETSNYVSKLRGHSRNMKLHPTFFRGTVCDIVIPQRDTTPVLPRSENKLAGLANFVIFPIDKNSFECFVAKACRYNYKGGPSIMEANDLIAEDINKSRKRALYYQPQPVFAAAS